MGKNAKEKKAFEAALGMRNTYIEQLKKCKTAIELTQISRRYEEKKKRVSQSATNLTPYHSKAISGLDLQIRELTEKLNARFFPVTPIESSPIVHEPEKKDTSELLPEECVLDELSVTKSTLFTQTKLRSEGLFQPVTKQSLSFDKPKPMHVTWSKNQDMEMQHHDKHVDQKSRRQRNSQLTGVKEKLRTLHTKHTKYDTKAKEYHKKKNQEGEAKYREAAKAAANIHAQIAELVNQYIRDGQLDTFKLNSQKILNDDNDSVKTLRTYRGWWEKFLDDLVELINSGLDRVGSSIRVHELSMFKPATTDGGHKINDLSNAIGSVKATI